MILGQKNWTSSGEPQSTEGISDIEERLYQCVGFRVKMKKNYEGYDGENVIIQLHST